MKTSSSLSSRSARTMYCSKIDWWIWAVLLFSLTVVIVTGIGLPLWWTVGFGVVLLGFEIVSFLGVKYAIEGNKLIVYTFFRPRAFPIDKIKDVTFTKGILSAPALSTTRLAIRFTDRTVLRSSMPLEISPRDREAFARHLVSINPNIKVIPPLKYTSPVTPE